MIRTYYTTVDSAIWLVNLKLFRVLRNDKGAMTKKTATSQKSCERRIDPSGTGR
jgi:hypothetical protein